MTIENALKFQQAAISATTDALTSLPNARSLFLHLDAELSRARRNTESLAVLICDLDGFKQVNDRFGHLEGNRVLKLVAAGLRECCREYDYVARMGGDEFVLVLPGLKLPDLADKIRALETRGGGGGLLCLRRASPQYQRGSGFLSGAWRRCGRAARGGRPADVSREADP